MIRLDHVSRTFQRNGKPPVYALRDLDLTVQEGKTMALLGPSGCGKTTTLRLINRLLDPSSGHISVEGHDTAGTDPVQLRRRMGYVVQRGGLFPHLTVRRNIAILCEIEKWERVRTEQRVDELLTLVGMEPAAFRDRFPAELSGGQRQRIGVARALALDPPILLMDEPFGALDPITRTKLQQEFKDLEALVAKTIVIVTHDLAEAFLLGDRVALLNEGQLVQVGTPDELRAAPATPWVEQFLAGHVQVTGTEAGA
jgi:osmoprotectant transport system ATP-binding protein